MFRNNFFHKNKVGESEAPWLYQKEKRGSAKSYVSKVLFPGIGKITNHQGYQHTAMPNRYVDAMRIFTKILKPPFSLLQKLRRWHILFSREISRQVKACWSRGWAKNQVSTNQNSRNSWCQIVRRTICYYQTSSTHLKPILNCIWFCLLCDIKDLQ